MRILLKKSYNELTPEQKKKDIAYLYNKKIDKHLESYLYLQEKRLS